MLKRMLVIGALAAVGDFASGQTLLEEARGRVEDLRLGSYATSHQVERMATDGDFRAAVWEAVERLGITKLYLEVYRGGHTVPPEQLVGVREWLTDRAIDVVGGIATVPGGDVGVRQTGPLGWFNWQNEKTQRDLERIIRTSAPLFDTFIVDDFLCTGDVSAESEQAKGERSWGQYRRELLTELAQSIFLGPAKQANPDITMIVKFPQWHDRFHLFGYDTVTFPRLFDRVWVGTETRGRNTPRFGFVQPYEGFINYRWLADIAGDKIGGAWFDHGDCAEHDFFDQAYMSVLAGAPELVFFNLGDVVAGHPDHAKIASRFAQLADLAAFVRKHPVVGVPAYKPPNSDPAGDMYLMDFLGMLGIPLVPVHEFPSEAPVIFLPAQAAADPDLYGHVQKARARGAHLILTTNLLIAWPPGRELAAEIGVNPDFRSAPTHAACGTESESADVILESPIEVTPRPDDVVCLSEGRRLLLLRTAGNLSLLNTHTYDQADFDAVGEVLLCPRPLGLLSLREPALRAFRTAFAGGRPPAFAGPASVTYHPFADAKPGDCVLQNFNDRAVEVSLMLPQDEVRRTFTIPARDRVWIASGEAR
ncbi:MAG TPA: hypothetical protein PLU87_03325 [Sedimentisphaerales bacterium]|nr:hypothetical protein [Sedimentisphaerales bacterium]HRS10054.1 hypothetical protein [Sedimentisphaerales bacterium]HRV46760.1 hypothetical protein [Sedimentisphaerales bacterium]